MDTKKRKKKEEKEAPHALNYEDMLNGFAREGEAETKAVGSSRMDLDGLALAELLGGEKDDPAVGAASGHFDAIGVSDYSELARQFEEFDLSTLTKDETETGAEQAVIPVSREDVPDAPPNELPELTLDEEDLTPEDAAGYAALLDQLEAEIPVEPIPASVPEAAASVAESSSEEIEPLLDWESMLAPDPVEAEKPAEPEEPPVRTEVLSFVNLSENRDAIQASSEGPSAPTPDEGSPVSEPDGLDLSDLFAEEMETTGVDVGESVILPKSEAKVANPAETASTGVDFLGITALVPPENRGAVKPVRQMEVLFDGVEMDFDDQTSEVTMAELLLAQGKKKAAAEIFQRISQGKGVTFWVAKRLRAIAATPDK